MSKGNLFLGQARGSVGDVTFTHIEGVQVARARNRSPRNPRVPSQMLQRIVLNTSSKAYSLMRQIVDHSFEGVSVRGRNQQRFMQLNTTMLRDKLADVIADPTEINALSSAALSYAFKGDFNPPLNEYIISEGTLPRMIVETQSNAGTHLVLRLPLNLESVNSYADVIEALGIQQGDQLTFIMVGHNYDRDIPNDQLDAFYYARVIMEPASGDMNINFLTDEDRANDPNPKNQGEVSLQLSSDSDGWFIEFYFPGMSGTASGSTPVPVGGAVILSRFESGRWRRSPQSIVFGAFGPDAPLLDNQTFGAAFASYLTGDSSNLYLNGSPVAVAAADTRARVTSVTIDGIEVAAGSAVEFEEGQLLIVSGVNLSDDSATLRNEAGSGGWAWDSVTPTQLRFQLPDEETIVVLRILGQLWSTITVVSPSP